MELSTLMMLKDYAGLIVGAILLILASAVLPGRVRWYVLTAGLAVIAYEGYQRYTNRKRLAEADAEREKLRQRAESLDKERLKLGGEVNELSEKLATLEETKLDLDNQLDGLIGEGEALSQKRQDLEQQMNELLATNAAVVSRIDSRQDALATVEGVDDVFRQFDEAMAASSQQ